MLMMGTVPLSANFFAWLRWNSKKLCFFGNTSKTKGFKATSAAYRAALLEFGEKLTGAMIVRIDCLFYAKLNPGRGGTYDFRKRYT